MTKGEQARLTAWRLKVLQQAADEQECRARLPAVRNFSEIVLQVEAAARRARGRRVMRSAADAAAIAARDGARRGQQDPLSAPALSLRTRPDRRVSAAVPPDRDRRAPRCIASCTRHGMNRLPANQKHQPHGKRWQRYEKPQPGHRLQLDVKFLERIPGTRRRLYQFTAIDDCTRIRVLKVYDACNQRTAIQFIDEVLRRLPFRVHVVQTDNGAEFQSQFHWHLETQDIRHVYIRPRTPHLNGKVERSHRVDDQEFYQLLDQDGITDDIHLFNEKLREWEDYYNYHRPHGALGGQTPYERLLAKTRAEVSPRVLRPYIARVAPQAGFEPATLRLTAGLTAQRP